jgi:tetratricopeptide (TPR) repeat protein
MERFLDKLFPRGKAPLAAFALVFAVAFALNFNVLYNGFLLDDDVQVVGSKQITDMKYLPEFFSGTIYSHDKVEIPQNIYRPLHFIIYLLTYRIFGLAAWGFHLVNLLFISLNAALVLLLSLDILKRGDEDVETGGYPLKIYALSAALLFAALPIHAEVASYVACIPELAFTFFGLLAFLLFIRKRPLAAAVFFFLSLLSKEPAIMLLPILVAYDALIARPKFDRALVARYVPQFSVAIAYFVIRHAAFGRLEVDVSPEISLFQTIVAGPPLLLFYLKNALLPLDVRFFRAFNPFFPVFDYNVVASSLVLLFAFAVALRGYMKGRPLGLLLAVFTVLPILPAMNLTVATLPPSGYADRYFYFSSIGLVMLFVIVSGGVFSTLFKGRAMPALALFMAAVFCWYSWLTINGNGAWKDIGTLLRNAYELAPDDYYVQYMAGVELQYNGMPDKAAERFKKSVDSNLAGRRVDRRNLKRAYVALSNSHIHRGDFNAAFEAVAAALRVDHADGEANYNLGVIYQEQGMLEEAVKAYAKSAAASRYSMDKADAYNNMGNAFTAMGRLDEAVAAYDAGLKAEPHDERLLQNRSVALKRKSNAQAGL